VFTGVEAALYGDKLWMQDFPFYTRRRPNLTRFFDYRIVPVPLDEDALGPAYRTASRHLRSRVLAGLQKHLDSSNTRTYDRVSYYVRSQAGASQSFALSSILPYYSPLCEPDVARTGFHLPRPMRTFDRFQRTLITQYCPALAAVRTADSRVTLSSRPFDQLRDLGRYAADRLKRLAKKTIQRAVGKTYFQPPDADHPDFLPTIVRSSAVHELIGELRDVGILAEDADVRRIGRGRIGKALTLALLVRHVDSAASSTPMSDGAVLSAQKS
jgi:hypothetical protein